MVTVVFAFGDASGGGFGSAFTKEEGIVYHIGVWTTTESEESSNYREFTNVVDSCEREAERGALDQSELYFFTDNSTVEYALYNGTSSSRKLLELVRRLKALEMRCGMKIFVTHVAGKRMIAVGVDGISRGILNEGIMSGRAMALFLPLHLTALERAPAFRTWLSETVEGVLEFLDPMDWFERGHDITGWVPPSTGGELGHPTLRAGTYVWTPPPAVANVALEELRTARHKRQASTHIFVCPRILTPLWLKQLYKCSDVVFFVKARSECWPEAMFKSLIIGISFPFVTPRPWQLRGTPRMFHWGRQLSQVFKTGSTGEQRALLRKLFAQVRSFDSLPVEVGGGCYTSRSHKMFWKDKMKLRWMSSARGAAGASHDEVPTAE